MRNRNNLEFAFPKVSVTHSTSLAECPVNAVRHCERVMAVGGGSFGRCSVMGRSLQDGVTALSDHTDPSPLPCERTRRQKSEVCSWEKGPRLTWLAP